MSRPEPEVGGPPGGPRPPMPPATGGDPPDPTDPARPIPVSVGTRTLGDLGHPRVDARLLHAILLRDQAVARWLRDRGVTQDTVREAFPGSDW